MARIFVRLSSLSSLLHWTKERLRALLRVRDVRIAVLFVCGLFVLETILFEPSYLAYFRSFIIPFLMPTPEIAGRLLIVPVVVALSILLVVWYVWASLVAGPVVRLASWSLFAIAVLVEYSYQALVARFSMVDDMATAIGYLDLGRLREIVPLVSPTAAAPVLAYGVLLLATRATGSTRVRPFLANMLGMVLFYSVLFPFTQGTFPTLSLGAFVRSVAFTGWDRALGYHGPRLPVGYRAHVRPGNNIVFIVDESVRPDHLSVNGYQRPTTPYLLDLRRRGALYSWENAVAGGTCSALSNALLLTGVTQLPDFSDRIRKQPTLFQYARAMNYRTHYFDGAAQKFWLGSNDDLQYIDDWRSTPAAESNYETDFAIARTVAGILRDSTGEFVWINKRGVHYPYHEDFPERDAVWTPTSKSDVPDLNRRDELVNAYDNALAYNIDRFFRYLLDDGRSLANTVIVYTSDHGQTLSEHGESWSHCLGTRNEALVPIVIIASPRLDVDTAYPASHHNLFATVLDLMGFPEAKRLFDYFPSLFKVQGGATPLRTYLVGSIDGRGFSRVVPFE